MGRFQKLISSTLAAISLLINCSCQQIADKFDEFSGQISPIIENISESVKTKDTDSFTEFIDPQSDEPYIILNDNLPEFDTIEITTDEFERYSELDDLGRCGVAYANISLYTMPTEEREGIGMIKPSGWHTVKYDCVNGKYLYNRCHLIGFQLAGENANKLNLVTGTRYMNDDGMLPFENEVADYVHDTGNHVLYRVTPLFIDDELVCRGVQMEALSVEDNGKGVCYNVFVYNIQPGIQINYATGESCLAA